MPDFPTAGRRALRKGRVSRHGQVYLITTTTACRRPLFAAEGPARTACLALTDPSNRADAALLAWVLMPDHWHGLLQLGDEPLGGVINRLKAGATRALRMKHLVEGPVWDRGYHDHALRADEDVRNAARYLVANPLRAGLATHVLDYPYWNAVWL
ncbi:REP-associated tyrosine transposase [Frateuria soli]|uniref:REP-associated tyrosine transposase n=1 Tax=Frateuria soli TaxID=1542730 RepID=UPI001E3F267F|nr:transposase [Frateuria soli]UGB38267.1 transposase [Frateuria soli]